MKKNYFKVVRLLDNKRYSMMHGYLLDEHTIRYKVHRYVSAPIGGLLVFADINEAVKEARVHASKLYGTFEVWKVLVKDPIVLPKWRAAIYYNNKFQTVPRIWSEVYDIFTAALEDWEELLYGNWPLSTQAFKQVRLETKLHTAAACNGRVYFRNHIRN